MLCRVVPSDPLSVYCILSIVELRKHYILSFQNDTANIQTALAEVTEVQTASGAMAKAISKFVKANELNVAHADLTIWAATIEAIVNATEPSSSRAARVLAAAVESADSYMRGDLERAIFETRVTPSCAEQEADLARKQVESELMRDFELAVQQELDDERKNEREASLGRARSAFLQTIGASISNEQEANQKQDKDNDNDEDQYKDEEEEEEQGQHADVPSEEAGKSAAVSDSADVVDSPSPDSSMFVSCGDVQVNRHISF